MNTSTKITLIVAAIAVAGFIGYEVVSNSSSPVPEAITTTTNSAQQETAAPTPATPSEVVPSVTSTAQPTTVTAAPKTVSVKTTYEEPSGVASVGFSLTVDANGVVTSALTDQLGSADKNKDTARYQKLFADGLSQAVVGKKLATLTAIDVVGGASLTTDAFNQSLDKLKASL